MRLSSPVEGHALGQQQHRVPVDAQRHPVRLEAVPAGRAADGDAKCEAAPDDCKPALTTPPTPRPPAPRCAQQGWQAGRDSARTATACAGWPSRWVGAAPATAARQTWPERSRPAPGGCRPPTKTGGHPARWRAAACGTGAVGWCRERVQCAAAGSAAAPKDCSRPAAQAQCSSAGRRRGEHTRKHTPPGRKRYVPGGSHVHEGRHVQRLGHRLALGPAATPGNRGAGG